MARILGVNAYHGDSSAAIICDGRVIAAVEEERFVRQKHWAGVPLQSIQYCLEAAGVDLREVDAVAINSDNRINRWKKLLHVLSGKAGLSLALQKIRARASRDTLLQSIADGLGYRVEGLELQRIEHHEAHLASAYYPSGFETAAILSVDGFGDFSSAAWGRGQGIRIEMGEYIHFPHSLGIFYQAITQYLGFPNYGDEYKVMGLASFGDPHYLSRMQQVLVLDSSGKYSLNLEYFRHHSETLSWQWDNGTPVWDTLYSQALETLLGPARKQGEEITDRHRDIAASAQHAYEEAFLALLHYVNRQTGESRIALAGGCAMNSVANGKVLEQTPFEEIYVQPAAGDAGGAIGAALVVAVELGESLQGAVMPDAYLGPEFNEQDIRTALSKHISAMDGKSIEVSWLEDESLCARVAGKIAQGAVVGWFQGRMEWGPRALGNRSILADPRRTDMQQLLNEKIKRRENFRPFAPSILEEYVTDWFDTADVVPYMEKVYPVRQERAGEIPAVVHVDGTGRLQTVMKDTNPKFHQLIDVFRELTGVPILLNTSFNENEPIVCTPDEALDCFLRTRMDILVLGNACVERNGG